MGVIINIDQIKVLVSNETLATRGENSVTIESSADEQSKTGTFAISLIHLKFFPKQLISGRRKTTYSKYPKIIFWKNSVLLKSKTPFQQNRIFQVFEEVIILYAKNQ